MLPLSKVVRHLDNLLELWKFKADCSNNGLQFEGAGTVSKIAFGVDACATLFEKAAEAGADMVFTHHGLSWGSSLKRITGVSASRISFLAKHDMSLYAVHLPLDAHPKVGHNAVISSMLNFKTLHPFGEYLGLHIGFYGTLPKPMSPAKIACLLDKELPSEGAFRIFSQDSNALVSKVGVVSGGGAWPAIMDEMAASGIECLVTGEVEHEAFQAIMESKASVVALGHYRTEIPGLLAVKEDVERVLGVESVFIDTPSGL